VAAFLGGTLGFLAIPELIERTMEASPAGNVSTLADVRSVDRWARGVAQDLASGYN